MTHTRRTKLQWVEYWRDLFAPYVVGAADKEAARARVWVPTREDMLADFANDVHHDGYVQGFRAGRDQVLDAASKVRS